MRPAFTDPTRLYHKDLISLADRGKPVRDRQRGTARKHTLQSPLNRGLRHANTSTCEVSIEYGATDLRVGPFIYQATMPLLPRATADQWRDDWDSLPEFRRAMRVLTIAWGSAFLIDAAARVIMAYTLPVDSVPLLAAGLLTVLLIVIVQFSKSYGKRLSARLGRANN